MSRSNPGSLLSRALRGLDRVSAPAIAEAHCDIPCGIYDPHLMQIAALTVVRMNQLIDGLELPAEGKNKAEQAKYHNSLSRYILVKEEHAELVKREARIIWGDYFKPEHVEKYPDLHATVWNIMKLAGKNRQEANAAAAADLLAATHRFAEIFWATKDVKCGKQPSRQAVGGEIVLPS